MDMWRAISTNQASPRNLMLHNIDNQRFISAVRYTVKKVQAVFPSPAGLSLTKLSLAGNNLIIPGQGEFSY
jgi:hypothetical protein